MLSLTIASIIILPLYSWWCGCRDLPDSHASVADAQAAIGAAAAVRRAAGGGGGVVPRCHLCLSRVPATVGAQEVRSHSLF